jgi:hypothetical protein
MRDLQALLAAHGGSITIVAMDREGSPFGITSEAKEKPYLVMTDKSDTPQLVEPFFSTIE